MPNHKAIILQRSGLSKCSGIKNAHSAQPQLRGQHHDEGGVDRMQDDVRQMMPPGVQPPEGVVEGVGDPGERVPVAYMELKEGPSKKPRVERADIQVLEDIEIIIPVHELISKGRDIDNERYQGYRSRKTGTIGGNVCVSFHLQPFTMTDTRASLIIFHSRGFPASDRTVQGSGPYSERTRITGECCMLH